MKNGEKYVQMRYERDERDIINNKENAFGSKVRSTQVNICAVAGNGL